VTVLTAMPNYPKMEIYEGYHGKRYVYEEMQGLKVHRSSIYVTRSRSVVSRLRNYFSFVISSMLVGRSRIRGSFDFLLCESPPLFLGYSAMYLARIKKAKLIFNVSDLWPESAEKLGVIRNKPMLNAAYRLERRIYLRSALVTGQTQGICNSISERFPSVRTYWLPNGADLTQFDPRAVAASDWRQAHGYSAGDKIFLYAGIIGIAQGLEVILNAAKQFRERREVKFLLLGEGPEKEKLVKMKLEQQLNNVHFLAGVGKSEMPVVLKNADAVIVPLKPLPLFRGAIPSKIFEALAMELPLILGVEGEASELFGKQGDCALCYEPGNAQQLANAVNTLLADPGLAGRLGRNGRAYVNVHFNRENIAASFLKVLKELHGA
jgi:glycosyltransferase involved in cell wall biosynthesis